MGSLLLWLLPKSNDPHCNLFSQYGRKMGANLCYYAFSILGNALCDIKNALQKGYFHSLAEKGRDPDSRTL